MYISAFPSKYSCFIADLNLCSAALKYANPIYKPKKAAFLEDQRFSSQSELFESF